MKHGNLVAAFALGALATFVATGSLTSQDASMAEAGSPGDQHEWLEELEGDFDLQISMFPVPGAPAIKSKATAKHEMILGGRFLMITTNGSMMGQKVESLTLLGFDRRRGEFVQVGADTLGTYFVTAAGKRNEESGTIVMDGVDEDPRGSQVYRFEVDVKNEDEMVSRVVFEELGGMKFEGGFTMVEMVATRKN